MSFTDVNLEEIQLFTDKKKPLNVQKLLNNLQRNTHSSHLVFQNEAKNIPRQDFVMMNISCKSDNSTYKNTFPSRGVTRKSLHSVAEAVSSCIVHSIHWIASDGYNNIFYLDYSNFLLVSHPFLIQT